MGKNKHLQRTQTSPSPEPPKSTALFLLHTLSPLHVGVSEGVGAINLPTAREVVTQYPYIPGSSIKGVLRDFAEQQHVAQDDARYGDDPVVHVFGPPSSRAGDARGGVVFNDALLLLLPMRSLIGSFALVTCPLILHRFARELALAPGSNQALSTNLRSLVVDDERCVVPTASSLTHKGQALLEDVRLEANTSTAVDDLGRWLAGCAWPGEAHLYTPRLAVVSDTLFGFFVRLNLEVRTRVPINDETGTAASSGPWMEEYIPAEALLYGTLEGRRTALIEKKQEKEERGEDFVAVPKSAETSFDALQKVLGALPLMRFGGKSSVGAGRALFRLVGPS